ncbi:MULTISPECIES: pyrroloquinoline quinone biosynthesis peptide chaperone PqqD [Pseudomonas]|uniref:PqqA binding protein n=1 Tax=Pseudomonas cichorii TaxID=36746 RepID=A0A3M4W2U6_PSECI|nr:MULTISPECIES: pyrroloquinoline quinone biosynthesis peptide chaperone PqqD [Pseudomonas]AHF69882.1 coenzyme PQQ biosynthesis protein PqqD [Pseudomonas cichorii JBC1]QVE16786.1 pyrroloquinoline quinone biosynthesis peptide chaperone PqqD [Pseudomonas cichorii]RMR58454.1 Coenzyme PQQ synthesis protein D [Pseudomonas cichorii]SDP09617.1 pyrroloquinoline quinone biosynthesis protein D [Pseudomonas cichorii]GFM68453.1 coenzyme PQQ synthesis protein D [Pseudomonas cichorii]
MKFDRQLVPTWRQGYRFQYEEAQKCYVLLYPEGMIQLNQSAGLIGDLVNGQRNVAQIIASLQERFPNFPEVGTDVEDFMNVAQEKSWINLG